MPDFHRLGSRLLHGREGIAVTFFAFDILGVEGLPVTARPYRERRALLEELDLERPGLVQLVATFEDGEALFRVICDRGLEGVVSKRLTDPYRAGQRGWVKTKNRSTAGFAEELTRATSGVRRRRTAAPGAVR